MGSMITAHNIHTGMYNKGPTEMRHIGHCINCLSIVVWELGIRSVIHTVYLHVHFVFKYLYLVSCQTSVDVYE